MNLRLLFTIFVTIGGGYVFGQAVARLFDKWFPLLQTNPEVIVLVFIGLFAVFGKSILKWVKL